MDEILKLIKKKKVDIKWLLTCEKFGKDGYITYNSAMIQKYKLTKEEFFKILNYYNNILN